MSRVWRCVAIWLVVLVLPLQGLAAHAAMRCLMKPDPVASTVQAVAEVPPCHAGMDTAEDTNDAEAASSDPASPRCPHCMACLALAATAWPLSAVSPFVGEASPAEGPQAEPQRFAIAFVTDGPDRPPRALQA